MKTYLIAYIALNDRICIIKINAENQKDARKLFYMENCTSEILAITELEQ